jgi:hypothetical protein
VNVSISTDAAAVNLPTFERSNIMRKLSLSILALAFAGTAFAAEPQTIELKDGGKIMIESRGTMVHMDAAGNRVKMKDGKIMEAKDGGKLMMKNNAIWKTITEHGTLKPGH